MTDFHITILITIFCFVGIYVSLFVVKKEKFLKEFKAFWHITPLPPIANYWLLKCFIILSSLFILYSIF